MLEELFVKIQSHKKYNWSIFGVYLLLNLGFIGYIIYRGINEQKLLTYIILFIVEFIIFTTIVIIVKLKTNKKINRLIHEEMMPYILRQISYDYKLTDEVFNKDEVMRSQIISRFGSFKSSNIVKINYDIPARVGFVSNYVNAGQSYYDVFAGTYIDLQMKHQMTGFLQLRDKGRAEKNKKLDLDRHQYKGEMAKRYSDIRFYTDSDAFAEKMITRELVELYTEIKQDFKKGFYLTITDGHVMIGIHNRKNIAEFSFFKKMNQDLVNKRIEELKIIDTLIIKVSEYIHNNFGH